MMKDRFITAYMHICPLYITENNQILKDLDYPIRLCVIDMKNKIAIDVIDKLEYKYLEVINGKYIEPLPTDYSGERVALIPLFSISSCDTKESIKVLKQLKRGKKFNRGNDIYNNIDYLEHVEFQKENVKKKVLIRKFIND